MQTLRQRQEDIRTQGQRENHRHTETQTGRQRVRHRRKETKTDRQTDKHRQKHVYAGKYLCYSLIFFGLNKTDRILDNHIPIMLFLFLL